MDSPVFAIYGGSFDPPTLGHLMVVSHLLLNDSSVDEVLIPPCFQQRGKTLTPFEHRMVMCGKQYSMLNRTRVLPIEQELGGESLTVRLVMKLHERYPKAKLRFVMGADLRETCHNWEGWGEIERLAPPLIIGRAGIAPRGPTDPTPISPVVSSTLVKEALSKGDYRTAGRYLTSPVLKYIEDHPELYLKKEEATPSPHR